VKYLVVSTASLVATILSCELFKLTNVTPVLVWDEAKGS